MGDLFLVHGMKVFICILVLVVTLTGYVSWHLWRITPIGWPLKLAITSAFLVWMASFFVSFIMMERFPIKVATVLYEVGGTWLIVFLYLLVIFLMIDIMSLFHMPVKTFLKNSWAGTFSVFGIVAMVMIAGGLQYHRKSREVLTITTSKPLERPLTIVMASDLHVGYHNRRVEIARWVDFINAEKPDLVLIGGDIIDRSLRPVLEGEYSEEFRRIQTPVYTVLGNHEYYSSNPRMMKDGTSGSSNEGSAMKDVEHFFRDAGIVMLRDSVVHFGGVDIIGRDDRMSRHRAKLKELTAGLKGFTILLDHQPYHLEEAEEAGIDFQFSGHTHYGQVWPLSWITRIMYEQPWGHHRRGNTRYYISSGLGIWGPKIRIGTRSEYLVVKLRN